jgi:mannosyltransferase OCH1-like enzyme
MTDEQGDSFVSEYYANRTDIVDLFLRLPIPIIKADLFRYLVLVEKGGIYADINVLCLKPMSTWLPAEHANAIESISLIVGLEFDMQFRGEGVEVASQFTNWILALKPGDGHLMYVVDSTVADIGAVAKKNYVDIEHLELWVFPDVVNIAGPKKMTIGILESLSGAMNQLVDDQMISDTKEPRLVGDVLVMFNNAFADWQAGYPTDRCPMLVRHHYAGSWKASGYAAKAEKKNKEKMEEQY